MKNYVKTKAGAGELAIYRVLTAGLADATNKTSSILILPQAKEIDRDGRKLTLLHYEGETFTKVWTVNDGGKSLDLSLAHDFTLVLKDLTAIDPTPVLNDSALSAMTNLVYEPESARQYFIGLADKLCKEGHITTTDYVNLKKILGITQTTPLVLNNGDFYPCNFIKQANGKFVLIDWEVWNDHSPFYIIDHPENVAAVMYVHMWGNPQWQDEFKRQLDTHFGFDEASFQKGVVIKALTLAHFFPRHKSLLNGQIKVLKTLVN